MIITNKLLPVALIAALIGGSVGALVMHKSQPATAESTTQATQPVANTTAPDAQANGEMAQFNTPGEQTAYKTGFADGFAAASDNEKGAATTSRTSSRVVYRNTGRSSSARRVYYDYGQPKGRSFWDKHRDKLTV